MSSDKDAREAEAAEGQRQRRERLKGMEETVSRAQTNSQRQEAKRRDSETPNLIEILVIAAFFLLSTVFAATSSDYCATCNCGLGFRVC